MDKLVRKAGPSTPEVVLDPSGMSGSLRGSSYPENVHHFYEPVLAWIDTFFESKPSRFTLDVELSYFNSSSSKVLFDLFDFLDQKASEGCKVSIFWSCDPENEASFEYGEELAEDLEYIDFSISHKDQARSKPS